MKRWKIKEKWKIGKELRELIERIQREK